MKKFVLVMAFAVLGTGAISVSAQSANGTAQQGQGGGQQATPEERAERQFKQMNELLVLTADQSAKVKPLIMERMKEQSALRDKSNGDRDAMMASMKTLQDTYNAKFKAILTAEQYTKYEANTAQMRGGRGGQGGGQRAAGQGNGNQ